MQKLPLYRVFKKLEEEFIKTHGVEPTTLLIGETKMAELRYELYANKGDYFVEGLLTDNGNRYHGLKLVKSEDNLCFELK
ncbi:hypothetical protein [Acinetobacter baumannii]|jgi:transcriptional/translational regulatory protein YebC/TACO1|uniref:hypothetical protein n=1 Tax=Acinetobacter baumannii TaxID=470 RepID=UPI001C0DC369|nr:hypothetical protein [Acinetobacter baumannii]MBU3169559.1 hypothetical protein [Acinetobacter baumannii]